MTRREINICASLACADMLNLGRDLRDLADAGVDWLHIDVMDGSFVPNFALSPDLMRVVSKASGVPLDVHLMVREPERYLERFVEAGASILVVHEEATVHLQRTLSRIRALGATPGVALNPSTSLHTLEYVLEDIELLLIMTVNPGHVGQKLVPGMLRKIADARAMLDGQGRAVDIQVDGNVSLDNAGEMVKAGANYLVGGTSSIFRRELTIEEGVARLRAFAEEAHSQRSSA